MAKKISELPAATAVADADEFELNQAGISRKATRAQIVAGLASASHGHVLADIADAGTLAARDTVDTAELADGAVTAAKLASGAVDTAALADTAVTPGQYANPTLTVDAKGRITAAASGPAGEANTASNVGVDGVGVFDGKTGVDLRFRHIAPASSRISVALNGADIDLDVVEANLNIPAGNVSGLAPVATAGTLDALSALDAAGGSFTHYLAAQDSVSGALTFAQADSGREKIYTGASAVTWTVPALAAGTHVVVHNLGGADLTFAASGVTLKGGTTLLVDKSAALTWLPGNVVKLTGELV